MQVRVYYEDTDAGGIVYHANYIKYCERARSEKFFEEGISPEINGGGFVAVHMDARFRGTAKLGDLLEVDSKIVQIKGSSLLLRQVVINGEKVIYEMTITLAFVKDLKPVRMDDTLREMLERIFASQ